MSPTPTSIPTPTTPAPIPTPSGRSEPVPGSAATWPCERFYWAILDAPGLKNSGPLPPGLLPELQEDVPVPVEDLHAVTAPIGDGRLLVCAASRAELSEVDALLLHLRPERLPPSIALPVDVAALEFLVGEFEPRSIRRARAKRHLLAAAAVLTGAAVAVIGFLRRAEHWREFAHRADLAGAQVIAQVAPGQSRGAVAAELSKLRPMTEAAATLHPPPDAARRLAALLAAWPVAVPSKPQSLSVTPTSTAVSVSIDGDAAPFLEAFRPPTGWRLDEPRLTTAGTITRVSLNLKPTGDEP